MNKEESDLLKKLRAAFQVEAEERLRSMSSCLIELERSSSPEAYLEIVETVFREAHSLKGAARSASMGEIERIFQNLESVFAALKRKQIELTPDNFDFLHKAVDTIKVFVSQPEKKRSGEITASISGLKKQLAGLAEANVPTGQTVPTPADSPMPGKGTLDMDYSERKIGVDTLPPSEKEILSSPPDDQPSPEIGDRVERSVTSGAVRISVDKLDAVMLQVQEMLSLKQIASQTEQDYQELLSMIEQIMKPWSRLLPGTRALRRKLDKQDSPVFTERVERQYFLDLFDTLDMTQDHMRLLEGQLHALLKSSEQARTTIGVMVDTIIQDVKKVLMLPFSSFLEPIPKLVRDLSRDQGKDIQLVMDGSEVEIDRRVLEEMRDPLIHILRNSVDHGIEKPEVRIAQNKPGTGTINISIKQVNGNKVEITVADDGAGVDLEQVKKVAVKRGFISEDQAKSMDDEAAMSLIFLSEISTSPIVTDISGRGLGLAIMSEKVEKLGGTKFIRSRLGQGTEFRIIIPITLATFRGLMLRVGEQSFVVPTVNVEQAVRIKSDEIRTVENRETISVNGRTLSFTRLAEVLELPRIENNRGNGKFITALILSAEGRQLAFGVDEVIDEEEVLLKPLGGQLSRVRNIYGAAVLGSGKVVAVLNVADLIKSAVVAIFQPARIEPTEAAGVKRNILIAEDSITSRMLLKNILESAGYAVKAVTDGLEAFTELKQGDYDLLVSDVDMPRMNGFVLTSKIRAEKKLVDLPVVLVTALQSREDRERGIDAGANAYIVKSAFDQSNLLEVINKLI